MSSNITFTNADIGEFPVSIRSYFILKVDYITWDSRNDGVSSLSYGTYICSYDSYSLKSCGFFDNNWGCICCTIFCGICFVCGVVYGCALPCSNCNGLFACISSFIK